MRRPVCVILGKASPLGRGKADSLLSKQNSSSSLKSSGTAVTEYSSSLDGSSHHTSTSCQYYASRPTVCFDVDEYGDVREDVYVYPAIEAQDKETLYWSKNDVSERSLERSAMIDDDCEARAKFIACVEELFNVPIRKRLSRKSVTTTVSGITEEEAIEGLAASEYRGYEHRCVRSIVALRRRALRQIVTAHWVRGGQQCHEVAAKLSARQARFARLVAQGDAKFAAMVHGEGSSSSSS